MYGSALLKASQAYPPKHGRLAAQQMRKWIPGDEPIISNMGDFQSPEDLAERAARGHGELHHEAACLSGMLASGHAWQGAHLQCVQIMWGVDVCSTIP